MNYMKRAMLAAITASAMFAAAPAYADLKMGVAAEPYAPFTSKDASGAWVGWEVDFMKALCAEIGETCVIEEVAWDGIIPALTTVHINGSHIGLQAARFLIERAEGRPVSEPIVDVGFSIIERAST